jgi:hypothetical protein
VIQIEDLEELMVSDPDTATPFISKNTIISRNSFADSKDPEDNNCPPPVYFGDCIIIDPLPVKKEEILKGFIL